MNCSQVRLWRKSKVKMYVQNIFINDKVNAKE